jgi:DNA-binding MarR family transcriptional regulator
MERISRLSTLLERQLEPVLGPHSLSMGEFDVLAVLRQQGPPFRLTPTQLTVALMMTSGGMTKRLASLDRSALIRRVPDPIDRRSKIVELTDEGRQLVERVLALRLKHEKRLLAALRKKQRRDLATTLRDLCVALGDEPAQRTRRVDKRR